MRITNLDVIGLHDFIDAGLKFSGDLAVIVGVNGAGKTSILSLASYLLKLDVMRLSRIRFKKFSVRGRVGKKAFELNAVRKLDTLQFLLKEGGKKLDEQTVRFPIRNEYDEHASRFAYDRVIRRIYDQLSDSPLSAYLKANAKLTLVSLDRTLLAEESDGLIAYEAPTSKRISSSVVQDPMARVAEVTSERYNRYRIELRRHQEDLTKQIVLELFKPPRNFLGKSSGASKLTVQQIENIRRKVAKMPYFAEDENVSSKIAEYFEMALATLQHEGPRDMSNEQHFAQFVFRDFEFPKIAGLVKLFAAFEKADNQSRSEIDRFESVVNSFLTEGGKEVFFSEREASLRFRLKGASDSMGRSIEELSSGERQIVTMLTYLAFMAGKESIFVVDEPELSLHLSWQMKLVDALLKLKPDGSQLVLATHSPEIVGRHRANVVKLEPQYVEHAE